MSDPKTVALESFRLIETGDFELAQRIIAPDYANAWRPKTTPTTWNASVKARRAFSRPASGCAMPSPVCGLNCTRRSPRNHW